jgi:hypothetical protein
VKLKARSLEGIAMRRPIPHRENELTAWLLLYAMGIKQIRAQRNPKSPK